MNILNDVLNKIHSQCFLHDISTYNLQAPWKWITKVAFPLIYGNPTLLHRLIIGLSIPDYAIILQDIQTVMDETGN